MSDRMTASSHSPCDVFRDDHSVQNSSVASIADSGSTGSGASTCDDPCVRTNGIVSPLATSKSATVLRSSPRIGAGVFNVTRSGPAIARSVPSSVRVTHGTARP